MQSSSSLNRIKTIPTPDQFDFPYVPYQIQEQFMRALFSVIENKKIGIFESPTGTGKTLTLMSSSLKWFTENQICVRDDLKERILMLEKEVQSMEEKNKKSTDWLDGQYDTLQKRQQMNELKTQLSLMDEYDKRIAELKEKWVKNKKNNDLRRFKHKTSNGESEFEKVNEIEDIDLIVEEVSDEEDDDGFDKPIKDEYQEPKVRRNVLISCHTKNYLPFHRFCSAVELIHNYLKL